MHHARKADPAIFTWVLAQIVPGFRVRTIPVLGTTPAVFGMAAAAHILCALAGAPLATEPLIRLQAEQYGVQLQRLAAREELLYGSADAVAVDINDVSCPPLAYGASQSCGVCIRMSG